MGKIRNKESRENEYLKGRIRKLEAKLKKYEKQENIKREKEEENKLICDICGKGELKVVDLKFVEYLTCDICDYKEKL